MSGHLHPFVFLIGAIIPIPLVAIDMKKHPKDAIGIIALGMYLPIGYGMLANCIYILFTS